MIIIQGNRPHCLCFTGNWVFNVTRRRRRDRNEADARGRIVEAQQKIDVPNKDVRTKYTSNYSVFRHKAQLLQTVCMTSTCRLPGRSYECHRFAPVYPISTSNILPDATYILLNDILLRTLPSLYGLSRFTCGIQQRDDVTG